MKRNERGLYHYSAFGIRIESEVYLPELEGAKAGTADVRIRYGEIPASLREPLEEGYFFHAAKDEFILRIDGVAGFYIKHGKEIIVQPFQEDDWKIARLYLLGTSLGILLMQRGMAPIHGSSVVIDGHGVIFTGVSGAGKSTLAAALLRRGYYLVSDDVSAITRDDAGIFWIEPGYPQQKLDEASALMNRVDTRGLNKIFDRNKYVVPVKKGFYSKPVRLAALYEITTGNVSDIDIDQVLGMERVKTLIANTYRIEFIRSIGLMVPHFRQCAAMAKQAPVFRLIRPADAISVDQQADSVIRHFKSVTNKNSY